MEAPESGYDTVMELLFEHKADVNTQYDVSSTVLLVACENGHEAVAKLLLENGDDASAQNGQHGSAPLAATKSRHKTTAKLLFEKGVIEVGRMYYTAAENFAALLLRGKPGVKLPVYMYYWHRLMTRTTNLSHISTRNGTTYVFFLI